MKKTKTILPTKEIVCKLIDIIDGGLVHGSGLGGIGHVCVEQAVATAIGLRAKNPTDHPRSCVAGSICDVGIAFNDVRYVTDHDRAELLKAFAIGQLGSKDIDTKQFFRELKRLYLDKLGRFLTAQGLAELKSARGSDIIFICTNNVPHTCYYPVIRLAIDLAVEALRRCGSPGCEFLPLINYNEGW